MPLARLPLLGALLGLTGFLVAPLAVAQTVYRTVGPDGSVVFSDRAPMDPGAKPVAAGPLAGAAGGSTLPFELRQVAGKFPVTLYTGTNCVPCNSGKAHLTSRGIPFTERTVNNAEDIEALQRLAGDNTLPLLTVGTQQIKGYSDAEWKQFLDAAGYPKTSILPASFRNAPAAPLVAIERPAVPAPQAASAAAEPTAPVNRRPTRQQPAAAPANNPAGILF